MDEEVITMDNFGVMGIAKHFRHLRTLQTLDAVQVLGGVVDKAHTDLPAFTDHTHHGSGLERSFKATDTAGEQGTTLLFQSSGRTLIHKDDALRVGLQVDDVHVAFQLGNTNLTLCQLLFIGALDGSNLFL